MAFSEYRPAMGIGTLEHPLSMEEVIGNLRQPDGVSTDHWEGVLGILGMIGYDLNGQPRVDIPAINPDTNFFDVSPFGSRDHSPVPFVISHTPTKESLRGLAIHTVGKGGLILIPLTTRSVFAATTPEERAAAIGGVKNNIRKVALGIHPSIR